MTRVAPTNSRLVMNIEQHPPLDQHHRSFPNFLELALFYLMVLTYFCMFWIWPSKHLLVAIDEVMMMVDRVPD